MPGRANRYTGNWLKPRPWTQHPLTVAIILLQTLFFKFTGAEEPATSSAPSAGLFQGAEPWGRIGSGVIELIAALLMPATASLGALIMMAALAGAIREPPHGPRD